MNAHASQSLTSLVMKHTLNPHRVALVAVLWATLLPAVRAQARCGDQPGDPAAIAATRSQVESTCHCDFATSHSGYVHCAFGVINAAVTNQSLSPQCAAQVKKCVRKSTCGSPGAVACCQTNASGSTRCSIVKDASRCVAHSGGSACMSGFSSCCDACGASGCLLTPTPSPRPTPTLPAFCQPLIGAGGALVPFKIAPGSTDCGGGPTPTPAAAPFSGAVEDANSSTIAQLGLGCLYTGALPGLRIPDGATSLLQVTGTTLSTVTLGGSDGTGPKDCTRGIGSGGRCLNGAPGTDGQGACGRDKDCGQLGTCGPELRCFFGPPIPVPIGACVVNGFLSDLCGSLDLVTRDQTLATALLSMLFLTQNPTAPCPLCVGGVCAGGANDGKACTAVGSLGTSMDCPPSVDQFFGTLTVVVPQLTTGTSTLTSDSNGIFCPDQTVPGAFAFPDARLVTETGIPLGGGGSLLSTGLAATFCVPRSGNGLLDGIGQLPAVGAFSAAGTIDLTGVLP